MLAIAASITWILAIRTIWKWSTTPTFAITLLLLSGAWQGSFNTVRQYVAGAIILAGHRFILERRLAPWILVVALASMFHVSAALAFLLYFVPRKRMRIPQQLAVILGAVAIFATSGEILQLIASFHEDTIEGSAAAELRINPLRVVFAFVPLIVLWVMPKPDALEKGGGWFYANMLVIYAACYVAFSDSAFLTRFTIYPQMFLAMSVTYATQYTNKTDRLAIRAIIITGFAIFMGNEIAHNDDLNNFQWIWNR